MKIYSAFRSSREQFELKINPSSLNFSKSVQYETSKTQGSAQDVERYISHGPETLSFEFILDSTGIAYEKQEKLTETIQKFEKVVYNYIGEIHKPNTLQISWGDIVFDCFLHSLKYDYTLFSPSGEPLRVKVSASFSNATTRAKEEKTKKASSPDLSHLITLKAGETIAYWCNKIYGDFSYCKEVAGLNGITNFRNVQPGTKLLFPKLTRYE